MPTPRKTLASQQPVARWTAVGKLSVPFSYSNCEYTGGNRLAPRERYGRDGIKFDDTGGDGDAWRLSVPFFNGNTEDGVIQGTQYPDEMLRLIDACKVHEVGDLELPFWGKLRCRAEHWQTQETSDRVDYGAGVFTFKRDSEESASQTFNAPSARSVIYQSTQQAVAALQAEGVWSGDVASLATIAADIENLASAPGDYVDELEERSQAFSQRVDGIERAFARSSSKLGGAGGMLREPRGARAATALRTLADLAARALLLAPGRPRPRTLRFRREVSIFYVATLVAQPFDEIAALNPKLEDLDAIPAGYPIRVKATQILLPGVLG